MSVSRYENMVAHPCDASLEAGIYGSELGLLSRVKVRSVNTSSGVSGYLLWCPEYHTTGNNGVLGNCFGWSSTTGAIVPTNTVAAPYGTGAQWAVNGGGFAINDPAGSLAAGDMVLDARTLSACMKMTYFGAMNDSSGLVGFIDNLPLEALLSGGTAGVAMSVDDVLRASTDVRRLGVDTLECVYRPSEENSGVFKSELDGAMLIGTPTVTVTTITQESLIRAPIVFGFAWTGLTGGNASLSFDLVKNVEWRPEPLSGINSVAPKSTGPSKIQETLAILDRKSPNWSHKVVSEIGGLTSQVAKMAFTGVGGRATRFIANRALGYASGGLLSIGN